MNNTRYKLPESLPWHKARWFRVVGRVLFVVSLYFVVRILWEMTFLSWERGPQMIGYAFSHSITPFFLPQLSVLCFLGLMPWAVLYFISYARSFSRERMRFREFLNHYLFMGSLLAISAVMAGSPFWQWVFAEKLASGPHAVDFAKNAMFGGNERLFHRLVNYEGMSGFKDKYGSTLLHYAVKAGNVDHVMFLLEKGAIPTARNEFGVTAMDYALHNNDPKMIEILSRYNVSTITGQTEGVR
jgi:hypothetical protein